MIKKLLVSLSILTLLLVSTASSFSNAETNTTSSASSNEKTYKTGGIRGKYYWIIYDNVCPYCKEASKQIKQLDWEGKFHFISYRDPMAYIMFPFLSEEECKKDIHMVTPDGKVLVGYKVFRTIIDNLTATKILNPLLQNDFAEKQLNEIYEKMVAKRSCYYEKTPACSTGEEGHGTIDNTLDTAEANNQEESKPVVK